MESPTNATENAPLRPTPASAWKGKLKVEGTDLELPSKNVALVKQMSPQAFMSSGLIPDPLSAIISEAINTKKGLPPQTMKKIADDPKLLASTMELFDHVLCYVVLEPVIEMPPPCSYRDADDDVCGEYANTDHHKMGTSQYHKYQEGPRNPDILYADTVDMEDKVFIFNWCLGGTRSLESFREKLQGSVESLSDGQTVQRTTKRAPRRK